MAAEPPAWAIVVELPVAWGDMDAFAHVNNAVYLRWFESARIKYFESLQLASGGPPQGVGPILARAAVNYRMPLTYPDTVRIGASITRIGTTSFVMSYEVRSRALEWAVAADGEAVTVLLNYDTGDKVPLSDELRQRITEAEAAVNRSPSS